VKRNALPLLALLFLGIASIVPVQAQTTIVNPRIVEFDPSADHSTLGADGQSLVQRYELRIFTLGNTQPYTTTDLGKPAPETDGKIRVDFTTKVSPWPPDGNYEARVAAVGPSGLGVSDPSNTFALVSSPVPTCTYTLSSSNLSVAASSGTSPLTVTTGSTCAWTATSNAAWLAPGTASGTGTATVSVIVSANTTTTARTATLTIAGQAVTVSQAAVAPCVYSASPSSVSIGASGGTSSVNVTAGGSCGWTATSEDVWASVSPASGSGSAPATITVAPNTSTSPRSTTVFVANRPINVTQAAAPCTFSLSATGGSVPAAGGGGTVNVSGGSGCGWTASSNVAWVTVAPGAGTAAGTVTFNAAPNSGGVRTATLTIAGRSYLLTQAGLSCSYSLTPSNISASGYTETITIGAASPSGCTWTVSTASSSWIALATTSGTANGTVSATLSRNSTKAIRTGTIVVGGQTCTITQATPPAPSQPKKPHIK